MFQGNVMNIAIQPRVPGRLATLNPFDLGMERYRPEPGKHAAARKDAPREERDADPADLGCVDWYLYSVSRKPGRAQR